MSHAAHWSTRAERGSTLALRLMLALSLLLGRRGSRPILWGISLYFFLTAPSVRRASRDYLQRVLPQRVRWWHILRHLHTFSIVTHDRIFLLRHHGHGFDLRFADPSILHAFDDRSEGMLLFGAHLGSFEALRTTARQQDLPVTVVMYAGNARRVMQTLALLDPAAQDEILPLGQLDSMLKIGERHAAGQLIGILADRNFGTDQMLPVSFLGGTAYLPDGPLRLATALHTRVMFMTALYQGGNRYDVHLTPLADFRDCPRAEREARMQAARERYAQVLEAHCRAAPWNWFNFFPFWSTPAASAAASTSTVKSPS